MSGGSTASSRASSVTNSPMMTAKGSPKTRNSTLRTSREENSADDIRITIELGETSSQVEILSDEAIEESGASLNTSADPNTSTESSSACTSNSTGISNITGNVSHNTQSESDSLLSASTDINQHKKSEADCSNLTGEKATSCNDNNSSKTSKAQNKVEKEKMASPVKSAEKYSSASSSLVIGNGETPKSPQKISDQMATVSSEQTKKILLRGKAATAAPATIINKAEQKGGGSKTAAAVSEDGSSGSNSSHQNTENKDEQKKQGRFSQTRSSSKDSKDSKTSTVVEAVELTEIYPSRFTSLHKKDSDCSDYTDDDCIDEIEEDISKSM